MTIFPRFPLLFNKPIFYPILLIHSDECLTRFPEWVLPQIMIVSHFDTSPHINTIEHTQIDFVLSKNMTPHQGCP
jgi:hypothetical protein